MGYKEDFIDLMLENDVLRFGEFITKSGRKSPYFINSGNFKSGKALRKLGEFYARCIIENGLKPQLLYGPAYKGIPLVTATASSLYDDYGIDVPVSFNRKEVKDHGEGGQLIGEKPDDNTEITIIEDVITAGTSVNESVALLKNLADVNIKNLIISVDRMEVGADGVSAIEKIKEDYGIKTYPIVTTREIINYLYNKEIDGEVLIDDEVKERLETYLKEYGTES